MRLWPIFLLGLFLALCVFGRPPLTGIPSGAQSLEASYHVLLTARAITETPISRHGLLPTVSLGKHGDKYIPWGATVQNKYGDYIYTSFTPPTFLVAFLFLELPGSKGGLAGLALLNLGLQALSALLLYGLIYQLLRSLGVVRLVAQVCSIAAITIGFFSREALQSFGSVYWSQQLYQPMLIGALLLLSRMLIKGAASWQLRTGLALLCFLGAWTEWTGFVFNLATAGVLFYRARTAGSPGFQVAAWGVLGATFVAALIIVVHFSIFLGFEQTMHALAARFGARNTAAGSFSELFHGYFLSYGLIIPWMLALATYAYFFGAKWNSHGLWLLLLAAALPVLENIIMLQHATRFSYDRLKLVVPAAILAGVLLGALKAKPRYFFIGLLCLALGANVVTYKRDMDKYADWPAVDARNQSLMVRISEVVDLNCAVLASNQKVRGYDNLVFGRGIYEHKRVSDLHQLMELRNGCAAVFVEGTQAFPDLPSYSKATILERDGKALTISVADGST